MNETNAKTRSGLNRFARDQTDAAGAVIAQTGDLTIGSGVDLEIDAANLLNGANYFLFDLTGSGSIAGKFATINDQSISLENGMDIVRLNGTEYAIGYNGDYDTNTIGTGNDVYLYAVPEPSTWAVILSGIGVLAFYRRARRFA